jgi:hypothetical protein
MTPEPRFPLAQEGLDSDDDVAAVCDGHVAWCVDDVVAELAADGYDAVLAELHVLAGLARQLEARLPEAVLRARQAWCTWDDIAGVLDVPASTLRGRYRGDVNPRKGGPIDP